MNQIHNLDEDSAEYFEFILKGNSYRMRYPTTEEIEVASKLKTDEEKNKAVFDYITPVNDAPPIQDVLKQSNIKIYRKFNDMVKTEFGE